MSSMIAQVWLMEINELSGVPQALSEPQIRVHVDAHTTAVPYATAGSVVGPWHCFEACGNCHRPCSEAGAAGSGAVAYLATAAASI